MELLRETERFALQRTEVSVQRVESSDGKAVGSGAPKSLRKKIHPNIT